ncbi:gamma-glutamylcyclotransferase [candidate division KSB1 bacterium]|nr:gamma-glutamylcyclotransferase [candidate division KSB1 bacterium]
MAQSDSYNNRLLENNIKSESNNNSQVDCLFVYGSLKNDMNVQLVVGESLKSEPAILLNHRKITPKGGFPLAVPWQGNKIEGLVLYGLTPQIIEKLDEYEAEGKMFIRKIATVKIGNATKKAFVYVGQPKIFKTYFDNGFEQRDRIEKFVEKSVDRYLEDKPERELVLDRESLPLRVTRELLSEQVHSLLYQYFRDNGLPRFIIKHEIEQASIPTLDWLRNDTEAQKYADNYISMAVKFMIFNQLEEKYRHEYKSQVKVSDAYYMHTLSSLMALKTIVDQYQQVQLALLEMGIDHYDKTLMYTDYAVAAIFIADELFQKSRADKIVDWVQRNRHVGVSTLGAELEFSNLGVLATKSEAGQDPTYDDFYYFYDFDLMRRGWKLGAHVDDHGFLTSADIRTRGFLELAFGRYKLLGDVSKPATQDPWVLSKLIELAIRFIEIKPHSLHISIGTTSSTKFNVLKDPDHLLCLLLLGGDLRQDSNGVLREMRIFRNEIYVKDVGFFISRLNKHHKNPDDNAWTPVVEYQFPRLKYDYDYQPLLMALKGFQLEANPYPFKNCKNCPCEELYKDIEVDLVNWATHPTPVSTSSINEFLRVVEKGLEKETKKLDGNYTKYCQRILGRIEEQLKRRNKRIKVQDIYAKSRPDSND